MKLKLNRTHIRHAVPTGGGREVLGEGDMESWRASAARPYIGEESAGSRVNHKKRRGESLCLSPLNRDMN